MNAVSKQMSGEFKGGKRKFMKQETEELKSGAQ